tara:strand:- start:63 stop:524 length:462 start_codon:yes stop_codon:yes gene_type:complete
MLDHSYPNVDPICVLGDLPLNRVLDVMAGNLPQRHRHWLKECEKAYLAAVKKTVEGKVSPGQLYKLAPELVADARKINDGSIIREMEDYVEELYQSDTKLDPASKQRQKFHFVSGYVHSHVIAGLIEEMSADRILDYINDNTNLFPEENDDRV